MQTIWDVYTFLRFQTRKPLGGSLSPEEGSDALEAGQMAVFNKYWTAGYGSNQTGVEALAPFAQPPLDITPSSAGAVTLPSSVAHILSMTRKSDGATYRLLLRTEEEDAKKSRLYPLATYPRYYQYTAGLQILPASTNTVILQYLKTPVAPVIAYTVDSDGNEGYNSGGSTQLQFTRLYYNEIIDEALNYIRAALGYETTK